MRVVVVGGGLSGLFLASELVAAGIDDVKVYEAAELPGGAARTLERSGYLLEPAAGSFLLPNPDLSPILDRAGVEVAPARDARRRHLYVDGRLVEIRPSPRLLGSRLVNTAAKLRMLAEPAITTRANAGETLSDFLSRRFGARAGGLMAALMASGVFAGDPRRLSAEASFPALVQLERDHGSVILGALRRRSRSNHRPRSHVPLGGLADVCDAIASQLGSRVVTGAAVSRLTTDHGVWSVHVGETVEASDVVVLAVRAEVAAGLIDGPLGDLLSRAVSTPVAVVWLGGSGPSPLPAGLGALVGPEEGLSTRGILFESSYAPARAPEGCWLAKVIVGGTVDPDAVTRDERTLISTAVTDSSLILGEVLTPDFAAVVRHRPGIPQYDNGHLRWLSDLEGALSATPGLHVTGWSYRAVGVSGLATDASRLAAVIAAATA